MTDVFGSLLYEDKNHKTAYLLFMSFTHTFSTYSIKNEKTAPPAPPLPLFI